MPRWLAFSPLVIAILAFALLLQPNIDPAGAQSSSMIPGVFNRSGPGFNADTAVLEGGTCDGPGSKGDCQALYSPVVIRRSGTFGGIGTFNYQAWYSGDNGSYRSINYAQSGSATQWSKYFKDNNGNISENEVMSGRGGVFDGNVQDPTIWPDQSGPCQCFVMLYTGIRSGRAQIGMAQTQTGVDFAPDAALPRPDSPVIPTQGGTYRSLNVYSPTLWKDGGTFKVWFTAMNDDGNTSIGYAESSDAITWNIRGTPVLNPESGYNDEKGVDDPMVIFDSGMWRMWYSGRGQDNIWRILYATSMDGVNWTKYKTGPHVAPGPAVVDDAGVYEPTVVVDANGDYRMFYIALLDTGPVGMYMAISPRPTVNSKGVGVTIVSGRGLPNAQVVIRNVTDNVNLGTGTVGLDGNYTVTLSQAIPAGKNIKVFVEGRDTDAPDGSPTATPGGSTDPCFTSPGSCSRALVNVALRFLPLLATATPTAGPSATPTTGGGFTLSQTRTAEAGRSRR
jgi:predicted GH43/DUF377 family glycosyl hydrolase